MGWQQTKEYYFSYVLELSKFVYKSLHTPDILNNGHFGTNINSSGLSPVEGLSSLRDSNRIILIGGIKFGDLVLSIVERYLIQCPFLGVRFYCTSIILTVI